MTLTKLAVAALCIAVAGELTTAAVFQHQALARLQDENQALRPQVEQLAQLQAENERLSNMVAVVGNSTSLSEEQILELARLRSEVGKLRAQGEEMAKIQAENRDMRAGFTAPVSVLKESLAKADRDLCLSNLTLIQAAKAQWALDNHKENTDTPTSADLLPYISTNRRFPFCPDRGTYILGTVGENARCNIRGHILP